MPRSLRVLLAEDDRFMRRACAVALRGRGHTVLLAEDGDEALVAARSQPLDLVLLDLLMPKRSGLDVLRGLKEDAATRDIPVLILSNSSRELERRDARALGAIGYFIKSDLSLKELGDRIEAIAEGRTCPQD
jgi:two-component system phosphate regulon response regulator PhoB